jgi:hypothetical protein
MRLGKSDEMRPFGIGGLILKYNIKMDVNECSVRLFNEFIWPMTGSCEHSIELSA